MRPLFYIGSVAILTAMITDAGAVLARHLGLRPLGSIELVQAAILVTSSAAVVAAMLSRKHARVHLLVGRVGPRARVFLERLGSVLSAAFFFALSAGSIWIAHDEWSAHEQSELLHIPYAPLRLIAISSVLGAAIIVLRQAVGRSSR
jgi:TRAP-type C4-dicarboxylate transport system permease small subunit